jgi:hypothetical protein
MVNSRFHWTRHGSLLGSTLISVSQSGTHLLHSTYLAISLVYARQVDLGCEGDLRRHIRVVGTTVDLDTVNAVLVDTLPIRQTQA